MSFNNGRKIDMDDDRLGILNRGMNSKVFRQNSGSDKMV